MQANDPLLMVPHEPDGIYQRHAANLRVRHLRALAGELRLSPDDETEWQMIRQGLGEALYSEALRLLCGLALSAEEGLTTWESLLAHRTQMEQSLGRPVALQTAALDRFFEARPAEAQAMIVPMETYNKLLLDARFDLTTGLSTKTAFDWAFQHEMGRARRYSKGLTLVLMDLDDSKQVAQDLGSEALALLLAQVSILLAGNMRHTDVAARLGADVFALLLVECRIHDGRRRAELLRGLLAKQSFDLGSGGRSVRVTASLGLSGFPRSGEDAQSLMRSAHEALMSAKEAGKNRVEQR